MGKKSSESSSPTKISKKPNINTSLNLMKILKPKVYITDTRNFKRLVQDLTGNHQHPPLETSPSPPPPPAFVPLSPWEVPFVQDFHISSLNVYEDNNYMINDAVSFGSSSSPELSAAAPLNCEMGESEKMEFYKGLESMLMMEMDSGSSDYDACIDIYHQNQMMFRQDHEVCVYDYDLSNFV